MVWTTLVLVVAGASHGGGVSADSRTSQAAAPSSPRPSELPARIRERVERDQAAVERALARLDDAAGLKAATPAAERVLEARRAAQGEEWWETVDARRQLEDLRRFSGMTAGERNALADVSARMARVFDPSRNRLIPSVPDELRSIAAAVEEVLGPDHPSRAAALSRLAALRTTAGQLEDAFALRTEATRILEGALGPNHPDVATALNDLAMLDYTAGRYRDAETLVSRALDIRMQAFGVGTVPHANSLVSRALVQAALGRASAAEKDYTAAAAVFKQMGPQYAAAYASTQNNLAVLYSSVGRDEEAQVLYEDLLKRSPNSTEALLNLASAYVSTGAYDRAAETATRGLTLIGATAAGRSSVQYASALETLAAIERAKARFTEAETRALEALRIRERGQGTRHPDYLLAVSRLASLRTLMGRYREAEQGYRSVLDAFKESVGEMHPSYAIALNELALLYQYQKPPDHARAEEQYVRAIQILGQTVGEQHSAYVTAVHNLGSVYHAMGGDHFQEAERRYVEARRILEQRPLERRALYATVLDNTARLYVALGRYGDADALSEKAIEIRRELFGAEHPALATSLGSRAAVFAATGREAQAASLLLTSTRADWSHVTTNLPFLSDEQKRQFLSQSEFTQGERLWSLVFERKQAPELGLEAVLLRKHLLFEATRQESGALRAAVSSAAPAWREMWDEDQRLRRQLAAAVLDGSTASRPVRDLSERLGALEERLRRGNQVYARSAGLQQVTRDDLVAALRPEQALVEFVLFRPYDFSKESWGPARYGAFVVRAANQMAAIDLGAAADLDAAVSAFREAMEMWARSYTGEASNGLTRRSERTVAALSSAIREKVWKPLQGAMEGVKRVYIAPDGLLSLVPFEVLASEDAGSLTYLVEQVEIVYLSSGRDLARLALTSHDAVVSNRAVLVGNPDFDLAVAPASSIPDSAAKPDSECDAVPREWKPYDVLTGLITEAQKKLADLGWDVTTLLHDDAREGAVLNVKAPRILQFGTHGHYLKCHGGQEASANMLARSMLMLAGANKRHADGSDIGDGILTAFEVSGMNLQGTELVNLTACETALGDVTPDGVAGFRQAFLWAGARSVTMSMWEVPAIETTDQLKDFYSRWLSVDGGTARNRYAAFRASQLAALEKARASRDSGHPFFWAGTVFIGDPGDLPDSAAQAAASAAVPNVNFASTSTTHGQVLRAVH